MDLPDLLIYELNGSVSLLLDSVTKPQPTFPRNVLGRSSFIRNRPSFLTCWSKGLVLQALGTYRIAACLPAVELCRTALISACSKDTPSNFRGCAACDGLGRPRCLIAGQAGHHRAVRASESHSVAVGDQLLH